MNDLYSFFYNKYNVEGIENDKEKALCESNIAFLIEQLNDLKIKNVLFLSEKQTLILRKRYGILDNGQYQTRCEIAKELGLSHQAVSQYLQRIIEKIDNSIMKINYTKINNDHMSQEERLKQPIDVLPLSKRVINTLKELSIINLSQLVELRIQDLTRIKGFGIATVNKLITSIHEYDLFFEEEEIVMLVEREQDIEVKKEKSLQLPIHVLGLSVRTYKTLTSMGVKTLGELTELSTQELKSKKGIGKINFREINAVINRYELKFCDEKIQSNANYEADGVCLASNLPIEKLDFPLAIYNALKRANINSVQDIIQGDIASLYDVRWLGPKGVSEVVSKIKSLGFEFLKSECNKSAFEDKSLALKQKRNNLVRKYRNVTVELSALAEKDKQLSEEIDWVSNKIRSKKVITKKNI